MFRTLADIRKEDDKGKGDKKKKNESYTGGEKSGMAVENPDDIEGVIAQAQLNSDKKKEGEAPETKPDIEIRITLYQNGFTVDSGEFRDYNTDENKEFMKELNEGYIPKELRAKYNKPVGIALEDKRTKTFRPPTPPKYVAYTGEGYSMGGAQGVGGTVNKDTADGKPVIDES
jgi:UBX domain-containing protein 1